MNSIIRPLFSVLPSILVSVALTASSFAHSPLHDAMKDMSRSFKALGQQLKEGQPVESQLESIAKLRTAAETASKAELDQPKDASPEDLKKREALFKESMTKLTAQIDVLAKAIESRDANAVDTAMKDLRTLRNSTHKDLGVDD